MVIYNQCLLTFGNFLNFAQIHIPVVYSQLSQWIMAWATAFYYTYNLGRFFSRCKMHRDLGPEVETWNWYDPHLLKHLSRYWVAIQTVILYLKLSVEMTWKQEHHCFIKKSRTLVDLSRSANIQWAKCCNIIYIDIRLVL